MFDDIPNKEEILSFDNIHNLPPDFTGWYWDKQYKAVQHAVNGKMHRHNGPAVKSAKVYYWYQYGKMHRLNGPARLDLYCSVYNEYWINDEYYEEEDYWSHPLVIQNKIDSILNEKI